tara:strand:+ start:422 stop:1114 length:693 start_codon:yes stop_codon:yes gene_type:complete
MRGSVKALIRFIQEKSVVDVVYLVMMILIVTMIKDMIMSMYRKRKDTNWLRGVFNNKQKKVEEKFTTAEPSMVCPTTSDVTQTSSVCEKLKFLLCDRNFEKVRRLLGGVTINDADNFNAFNFNTYGGHVITNTLHTDNINSLTGDTIHVSHKEGITDHVVIKLYGKLEVVGSGASTLDTRSIDCYIIKCKDIGHHDELIYYRAPTGGDDRAIFFTTDSLRFNYNHNLNIE